MPGPIAKALLFVAAVVFVTAPPSLAGVVTERVSVRSDGQQSDGNTDFPAISGDGRFVVFESYATNLISGAKSDGSQEVYVHDRRSGRMERISIPLGGGPGGAGGAAISANGRFVAFVGDSPNLVPNDTNHVLDIFVRDRLKRTTERVSVNSNGMEGNDDSTAGNEQALSMSANGRLVVFVSKATNLVDGDTNGVRDCFVHNRRTGITKRVNVGVHGQAHRGDCITPALSADGRFVAFSSFATDLVAGEDTNELADIFVRDRLTGVTELVSVGAGGVQAKGCCFGSDHPSVSADGRFVAFDSTATNLISPNDPDNETDIFVRDRLRGTTERISVGLGGVPGRSTSVRPSISADGRFVAFQSFADNLVPNDTNRSEDIFVRDRLRGTTVRMSLGPGGRQANEASFTGTISANGGAVVYWSVASNLVRCDTNRVRDAFVSTISYTLTFDQVRQQPHCN